MILLLKAFNNSDFGWEHQRALVYIKLTPTCTLLIPPRQCMFRQANMRFTKCEPHYRSIILVADAQYLKGSFI